MPLVTIAIAALSSKLGLAKAVASAIGSILQHVHQHLTRQEGDVNTPKASILLIQDDKQPNLVDTQLNVYASNALVQYASRAIVVQPSSSKVVTNPTSNDSLEKSLFNKLLEYFFSTMIIYAFFADWYRARIIVVLQSALSSFITDERAAALRLVGTEPSACIVQKKVFVSILYFIQLHISGFVAEVINGVKKVTVVPYNVVSTFLEQPFTGLVKQPPFDLVSGESTSAADASTSMLLKYLAILVAYVQGIARSLLLERKSSSLRLPQQLRGVKLFASMCLMLLVNAPVLSGGWKAPDLVEESLQRFISNEHTGLVNIFNLEASSRYSKQSFLPTVFPDDQLLTDPLMDLDAGLVDNSLGTYDAKSSLLSLTNHPWNDEISAASSIDWNNGIYCIQGTYSVMMDPSGAALNSLFIICALQSVPVDVLPSRGFTSKRPFAVQEFGGGNYTASAIDDNAIVSSLPARSQLRSASYGYDYPNALMLADVYPPGGLSTIQYDSTFQEYTKLLSQAVLSASDTSSSTTLSYPSRDFAGNNEAYVEMSSTQLALALPPAQYNACLAADDAISPLRYHQPNTNSLTVGLWHSRTVSSVLKALAVMMLLALVYCDPDDANTDHSEASSTLEVSLANLQEVPGNEASSFEDERNEAEETLSPTIKKPSRRESMVLHSELGRHWTSPPKRRCRRSPRKRKKDTRYQPI